MANNPRRRSWFSPKLPLSFLAKGDARPAKNFKRTSLRVEGLEDRVVPTISLQNDPDWVSQGGLNTGSSTLTQGATAALNNQSGGSVTALATPYGIANTIYAGSTNGGVWRSFNGGTSWTPLTDFMPSASITDIAINPFNTSRVLVGLGATSAGGADGYTFPSGDLLGMYYSTNADDPVAANVRWRIIGAPFAGTTITGIAARNGYLLASNANGLYRSADDGNTWNLVSGTGGLPAGAIFDLAEVPPPRVPPLVLDEPTRPDDFYVVGRFGVFRSTDGGVNWTNMNVAFTSNDGAAVTLATAINAKIAIHFDVLDYVVYAGMVGPNPLRAATVPGPIPLQQSIPSGTQETYISWVNLSVNNTWTRMDQPRQLTTTKAIPLVIGNNNLGIDPATLGMTTGTGGILVSLQNHALVTGDHVRVDGVAIRGVDPDVDGSNGDWQVQVVNIHQFILLNATFNGTYGGAVAMNATGRVAKWIDPTYGSTGALNFSLVADNYDPTVVFVGGDFTDRTFNNTVAGSVANSGNVVRGNRSANLAVITGGNGNGRYKYMAKTYPPPPAETLIPQWTAITNNAAQNPFSTPANAATAPHNGSRIMVMDANYSIVMGTEGGLFRWNKTPINITPGNPAGNPNPISPIGYWTSLNDGLYIEEVYSVGLDIRNNILVAATNTNGTLVQSAPNSLVWNTISTNLQANTNRGQGYQVYIDNSGAVNTIRYTLGNNAYVTAPPGNPPIVRQVFNGANTQVGAATSVGGSQSNYNPFVINAVDPTRALLGGTSTTLLNGPYGLLEITGVGTTNTATAVTPPNMFSQPSQVLAIAYGGRNPDASLAPEVAYIGTSNGQIFVRGQGETVFFPKFPPGLVRVTGIVMDPNNWRIAYAVRGADVIKTTDGGNTWTLITDNLKTAPPPTASLTTELRSIALWVDPGNPANQRLVVGGRGGYFRRDPAAPAGGNSTWSRYGSELPYVLGQDIHFYGNKLVAGTFGRGVWTVEDVSTTIDEIINLQVDGTGLDDDIYVFQDPNLPNNVIVSITTSGVTTTGSYDRAVFQRMTINSMGGNDRIFIDSNGALAGGDTAFVNFQIAVDAGGQALDQLFVENAAGTTATTYTISGTQISSPVGESLFGSAGYITYAGLAAGTVTINNSGLNDNVTMSGNGAASFIINDAAGVDTFTVNAASGVVTYNAGTGNDLYQINSNAGTLTINGGSAVNGLAIRANTGTISYNGSTGNDTIYISSTALATLTPVTPTGVLGGNTGVINIVGNGGTNLLNATDLSNAAGSVGTLNAASITGFAMGAGAINYTGITTLNLTSSDSAASGDTILVAGTGNALSNNIFLGQGGDIANIRATGAGTTTNVNTGAGANVTNVSSDAGTNAGVLAGIQGLMNIIGGGADILNVSDFGNAAGSTGSITAAGIAGFGMGAGGFTYSTIPTLNVRTSNSSTADSITVTSTAAGTTTLLLVNDGNDAVNIVANAGPLTVRGGNGDDTFNAGSTGLLAGIQGALVLDGEGGAANVLNISDFSSALNSTGVLTPIALTGFGMGASGIGYTNFATLNLSTSTTGNENLTVTDTMAGTTNIATNGGADTINVRRTTGATNVNAGLGADTANVSSDAAANLGVLSGIQGSLFLDGGDTGTNTLNVSDFGAGASVGTIGNGTFTGFGMGPTGISHIRWNPVSITFGSVGPNVITVVGTTPGTTTIINGSNGDDIFNIQATNATGNLAINGLGGNDTVNVSSDAPANTGNLAGIQGGVSFDGGVGSNTLNVSDIGNLGFSVGTIAGGTITGFGMGSGGVTAAANVQFINIDSSNNQLLGDSITVTNTFATGLTTLRLNGGGDAVTIQNSSGNFNVLGGDGNDVIAIQRNSAGTISASGGLGNDTFNVSGSATAAGVGANGVLAGIAAPIILNGDQGTNTINISDLGNATGSVGTLNAASVTGFGITGAGIAYTNFAAFNFDSSNISGAADVVTIAGTMAGPSVVRLNDGNDTANVQSVTGPLQLNAGAGNDTVNVGTAANTLVGIQGLLTVDGGTGNNTLNASNLGATTNLSGILTSTAITGFGMVATGIAFSNISTLGFNGSNTGNDILNVVSTIAGTTTVLGNGGNDTMTLQGDGLGGANTFDGGTGDDLFTVNAGSGITALSVQLTGGANSGAGRDRAVFNGRTGNDTIGMTLATANSSLTGLGTAIGFNTIEGVTVDGLAGADTFSIGDATNTSYGTVLAPITGVVYRPTGANAGNVRFNMNATTGVSNSLSVTPDTDFKNITGNFLYNGDIDSSGDKDVVTVLGVSQTGNASPVWNETTASSGIDTISAADSQVNITNQSLGLLHGMALIPTSVSSLFVRAGNEGGSAGDIVTATPSTKLFLYLDGQNPAFTTPGDRLTVPTVGTSTNTPVTDPNLGPAHRRITDNGTGGKVDFINFETVNGSGGGSSSSIFAVGSDAGTPGRVQVYDAATGAFKTQITPYPGFTGGIRVAVGDVNGDGIQDIITATGPGGGPHVKVFNGVNNAEIYSFFAYAPNMSLGVDVAAYDLNLDGKAEIITTVGAGGGPHVRVFDGANLNELRSFFAYAPGFTGGVSVAAGDIDGDGQPEIVTTPLSGGGPHVIARRFSDMAIVRSFFAFDPAYFGGLNVSVGDINGDFVADIVVGTNGGSAALVTAFDTRTPVENRIAYFFADTGSTTQGGQIILEPSVRTAVSDVNADGINDILVARGAGTFPRVRTFRVNPGSLAGVQGIGFDVFEPSFGFGVYLGAK